MDDTDTAQVAGGSMSESEKNQLTESVKNGRIRNPKLNVRNAGRNFLLRAGWFTLTPDGVITRHALCTIGQMVIWAEVFKICVK